MGDLRERRLQGDLRGVFRKRIEVGPLIPYSEVTAVGQEPSGPHTARIVVMGAGSKPLARIDFGAGGLQSTPAMAAAHRGQVYATLQRALDASRSALGEGADPRGVAAAEPRGRPARSDPAPANVALLRLPADIVSRMERYGRRGVDPFSSGEPGPMDPGWEPILPVALGIAARDDPKSYVRALAAVVGPVGGWAVYGAAEFALDVGDHDLDDPAYRRLFVDGLMVRREAGVPWPVLNGFDQTYWNVEHPDEPWLPPRRPPTRDAAVITPLAVGDEREIARVSGGDDPTVMFVTRPSDDRYAIVLQHPQDDGPPTRGEMCAADSIYDAYLEVGMHEYSLAHFWNHPEFEPFCRHVRPRP